MMFSNNTKRYDNTFLARVNPELVVIDPTYLDPSSWDSKAIVDDLREYVRASRSIKATPLLRAVDNELKLVSGEPFMKAALDINPPLHEVVCLIEADDPGVLKDVVTLINAADLLKEFSENETYKAVEMLTFTHRLNEYQRQTVEDQIATFFHQVHANPSVYGGNYLSISVFDWDELNIRIQWIWERNDQTGKHQQVFLNLLRRINDTVATLRSWNGLTIHFDDF